MNKNKSDLNKTATPHQQISSPLEQSPLGRQTTYPNQYDSSQLVAIPRSLKRDELNLTTQHIKEKGLPFFGTDQWTGYELSWLNDKGKPEVAILLCEIPCESENIIESKSFKLYLNSFNQTRLNSILDVQNIIQKDISQKVGVPINATIVNLNSSLNSNLKSTVNTVNPENPTPLHEVKSNFDGIYLDSLDIEILDYDYNPNLLQIKNVESKIVREQLHSNLLKSNCLVTGQPDWGSVYIEYEGPQIDHESLLRYLISFRQHEEFHEQCVERIFMDLMKHCRCHKLTVFARYLRRGGLDINPFRSNDPSVRWDTFKNLRLVRQ